MYSIAVGKNDLHSDLLFDLQCSRSWENFTMFKGDVADSLLNIRCLVVRVIMVKLLCL